MTKLTPEQNTALGELNAALYKAKNTGVLEKLSVASEWDDSHRHTGVNKRLAAALLINDFYKLVGKLCADNRVLGDSASSGEPDAVFTARVQAVTQDGIDEELIALTMGVSEPGLYRLHMPWEPWPSKETLSRYEVEVSRADKNRPQVLRELVALPPDTDNVLDAVHQIMFCRLPATLRRQAWVNDYAVDIDDGDVHFNAMANLVKMDLREVQEMFARGVDFDELANGLPEREAHSGPFEVDVCEEDVVRMVCLLSGMHGALGENDSVSDITQPMWDDFVTTAHHLLQINGGDLYGQLEATQDTEVALQAPGNAP